MFGLVFNFQHSSIFLRIYAYLRERNMVNICIYMVIKEFFHFFHILMRQAVRSISVNILKIIEVRGKKERIEDPFQWTLIIYLATLNVELRFKLIFFFVYLKPFLILVIETRL